MELGGGEKYSLLYRVYPKRHVVVASELSFKGRTVTENSKTSNAKGVRAEINSLKYV